MKIFISKSLLLVLFYGCGNVEHSEYITKDYDSLSTVKMEKIGVSNFVLDSISPSFVPCIQYIYSDSGSRLITLNEETGVLNVSDFTSGEIVHRIVPKIESGKISKRFQGFYYRNKDSVFLIGYKPFVFLINETGDLLSTFRIGSDDLYNRSKNTELAYKGLYVSTAMMPHFYNDCLYISSVVVGDLRPDERRQVQIKLNLSNGTSSLGDLVLPDGYFNNYGGLHYYIYASTSHLSDNKIIYSFPISPDIYIHSLSSNVVYKKSAPSKYIQFIQEYDESEYSDSPSMPNGEYFMRNPSFGVILYDQFRDLYYRFALLPVDKKNVDYDAKDKPTKQISIVVYDSEFRYLGETLLERNLYWPNSAFVSKEGLNIQNRTPADSTLVFSCFSIKMP